MLNPVDYSQYKCPYSHLKKDYGHKLEGPEGYEGTHGVWCACGFRGPVFYLDPDDLNLEKKDDEASAIAENKDRMKAWISITDALPEKRQYVLLIAADRYWNTEGPSRNVTATGYLAGFGTLYWSVFGGRGHTLDAFTHWMPIPDLDAGD